MTKLTWMNIIRIIERAFELTPAEISRCLGVERSTVTRLKNGLTRSPKPSLTRKMIYERLFDPTTGLSRNKEETLLDFLKESLEHFGLKNVMDDVWDNRSISNNAIKGVIWDDKSVPINYKTFVLMMLERTYSNPKLSKPEAAEHMRQMFREIVERCSLTNFLEGNTADVNEWDDLQSRVDACIQAIDEEILQPLNEEKYNNNFMYRNIKELHLGLVQWFKLSLLLGSFSEQPGFKHDLDDAFRRIYSSHEKIIGATSSSVEYTVVVPESCDEAVKAIFLSGQTASPVEKVDSNEDKAENSL